jgi:transposase
MNIRTPTLEEIHAAFDEGEKAVVELFANVEAQLKELAGETEKLLEVIKELQSRLEKNSRNSSKPPSSDGYRKPPVKRTESLRKAGQKPNGGQPGHVGETLKPSANPDYTRIHVVESCEHCGTSLKDVKETGCEERQVFDIPAMRIEVTAHRAEIKICPNCGMENHGKFPDEVRAPVQYGDGVKSCAAYFTNQHFVSVERTTQIIEDLWRHPVSEAMVLNAMEELSEYVVPSTEAVKERLRQAEVIHTDESGVRVKGKLNWLHVTSTELLTHYEIHANRGQAAIDEIGILTEFKGVAVHDHWKPYFRYEQCDHALCNAHHLRELKYIEKQYEQAWAAEMAELLREIKKVVDEFRKTTDALPPERIQEFTERYHGIMNRGYAANPRPLPTKGATKKRGRCKQTPPLNLLDRLRDFKPQVLAFMHDFRVPFDNNQAERDIRMVKVKQKVSGSFRTVGGGDCFARVRGYISTARKNAVNVFSAIKDAFCGVPFIPSPESK